MITRCLPSTYLCEEAFIKDAIFTLYEVLVKDFLNLSQDVKSSGTKITEYL